MSIQGIAAQGFRWREKETDGIKVHVLQCCCVGPEFSCREAFFVECVMGVTAIIKERKAGGGDVSPG